MTGIVCNYCAICIDSDCQFEHSISIKDRKVVRKLYDELIHPNKTESNVTKRRANCKFGQICFNESCGFRHRLNFTDRMKLVNGFNTAKLNMMKTEKIVQSPKPQMFMISSRNSFECLEVPEIKKDVKSWADMNEEEMTFDDIFPTLVK